MDVPDILVDSSPLEKQLDLAIRNEGSENEEMKLLKKS